MKKILAFLLLAFAPLALAESALLTSNFDVDLTSYSYPRLCTPPYTPSFSTCPGVGAKVQRLATTSAVATTAVVSVNTDGPFDQIGVGDVIVFDKTIDATTLAQTGPALRTVTAVTDDDTITVDSNVTIAATGSQFSWWDSTSGTGASDGWFNCAGMISMNALISITQISLTGGIDYTLQGRHALPGGGFSAASDIVATTNKTATGVSQAAWSLSGTAQGPWDQCRIGLKVGTSDDDGVLITANTDNIDFKEYVNSYTVGDGTDLDFVEDAGGTPKVCVADDIVVTDPDTGAGWCTAIAAAMNGAACTPDNTYSCAYSTSTHKFTIARATGTKSIDLLWNTGTNTLTSIGPEIGFPISGDSTGATTYAGAVTGESVELNGVVAAAQYASGTTACVAVAAAMQAEAVAGTYACSYSVADDKVTISATGITQLMVLWNSGTNNATAADTALGFAADVAGALTYEGVALGSDASDEVEKVTITVAGYK